MRAICGPLSGQLAHLIPVFRGKRRKVDHGIGLNDLGLSTRTVGEEPVVERRLDDRAVIDLELHAPPELHLRRAGPDFVDQVVILGELGVESAHELKGSGGAWFAKPRNRG